MVGCCKTTEGMQINFIMHFSVDSVNLTRKNRDIRYLFLSHADETHVSMFPKVFPINPAETEDYPSLSNLEAIYHTCPFEQYKYGLPVDESVGTLSQNIFRYFHSRN